MVGGNMLLRTKWAPVKISLRDMTIDRWTRARLAVIGYYDPPPHTQELEDWLLGQSFLIYCKHTWERGFGGVRLELED